MQYSPQLIQRIKEYFNVKYGEVLSDDEAIEQLDAFAELYQIMATDVGPQGNASRLT